MEKDSITHTGHPELVSGSIHQPRPMVCEEKWTLKQVQGDEAFITRAVHLSGQTAILLGWRPDEFWTTTPAELAAVIAAFAANGTAPPDADTFNQLKERFPDAPTGGQ